MTLFEKDYFDGNNVTLNQDKDFTGMNYLDNRFTSFIVEEKFEPVLAGMAKPASVEEKTQAPEEPKAEPQPTPTAPPCNLSDDPFSKAVKAIDAKSFSEERMAMAKLVTKGKCLTNDQIRTIARMFSFDEESLDFVKYAYELASEKDTYYTLEDAFRFNSVKEEFLKFLSGK